MLNVSVLVLRGIFDGLSRRFCVMASNGLLLNYNIYVSPPLPNSSSLSTPPAQTLVPSLHACNIRSVQVHASKIVHIVLVSIFFCSHNHGEGINRVLSEDIFLKLGRYSS